MADRPASPMGTPFVVHNLVPPPNDVVEERFIMDDMEGDEFGDAVGLDAIYSVQKMAEVLVEGPDMDREFILFELQQLLDHCPDDTLKILVPVLCTHVSNWNVDLQIKAAARLRDVVRLKLEPVLANMISNAAFDVVESARGKFGLDFDVLFNWWGDILVEVFPSMQWNEAEPTRIISLLDLHSKESCFSSRKLAALVYGALAQCLDAEKVEKMVLPRCLALFEDEDLQVRGNVIESLAYIGAALPLRLTESKIWPKVERLLEPPEDDARVRASAMRTMAHILKEQREKGACGRLFREILHPVFIRMTRFARKWAAEDQRLLDEETYLLLEVVSEVYGQFVYALSLHSQQSFRKEAYRAYAALAACNGPLIRRHCSYNFPGVSCALGDKYAYELSRICEDLATDADEETRWILSAGMHKSAALLVPKGDFERLFNTVCCLLQDENPIVRMNAIENFHELLCAFVRDRSDTSAIRGLAPVFAKLGLLTEGEWRSQKLLAEELEKCVDFIPSDVLVEHVLPLLRKLAERGTPPVRVSAMNATTKAFRKIPDPAQRNAAIEVFWAKNTEGSYWMRLALLEGGDAAMRVFSQKRFAELFSRKIMLLADDPVVNVRIRVAKILPKLAPTCYGTPEYNCALARLRRDKDKDVLDGVARNEEMAAIEIQKAKEREKEDNRKFEREQEFYGLSVKSQKKARMLAGIRSGRLLSKLGSFEDSAGNSSRFSTRSTLRGTANSIKSLSGKGAGETTRNSAGTTKSGTLSRSQGRLNRHKRELSLSNLRHSSNRRNKQGGDSDALGPRILVRSKSWSGIIMKKFGREADEKKSDKIIKAQGKDASIGAEGFQGCTTKKRVKKRSRKRASRPRKVDSDKSSVSTGGDASPWTQKVPEDALKVSVRAANDVKDDEQPSSPGRVPKLNGLDSPVHRGFVEEELHEIIARTQSAEEQTNRPQYVRKTRKDKTRSTPTREQEKRVDRFSENVCANSTDCVSAGQQMDSHRDTPIAFEGSSRKDAPAAKLEKESQKSLENKPTRGESHTVREARRRGQEGEISLRSTNLRVNMEKVAHLGKPGGTTEIAPRPRSSGLKEVSQNQHMDYPFDAPSLDVNTPFHKVLLPDPSDGPGDVLILINEDPAPTHVNRDRENSTASSSSRGTTAVSLPRSELDSGKDTQRPRADDSSLFVGQEGSSGRIVVQYDDETGLPTFKGTAPWTRRGANKIRVPGQPNAPVLAPLANGFATRGLGLSDDKEDSRKLGQTAGNAQSTSNILSGGEAISARIKEGANGFLRLFRRKRSQTNSH